MPRLPLLNPDELRAEIDDSYRRIDTLTDNGSVSADAAVRQSEAVATQRRWIRDLEAQLAEVAS